MADVEKSQTFSDISKLTALRKKLPVPPPSLVIYEGLPSGK